MKGASHRALRRTGADEEFFAQWRRESDVLRARDAGGTVGLAVWAALRAIAGELRNRLDGRDRPTMGDVADDAGVHERTAALTVAKLEKAGMLRLERPAGRRPIWVFLTADEDPRRSAGGGAGQHRGRGSAGPGEPRAYTAPGSTERKRDQREEREGDRQPLPRGVRQVGEGVFQPESTAAPNYGIRYNRSKLKRQAREMLAEAAAKAAKGLQ